MMPTAQRAQVAQAGESAVVEREGVVDVAPSGWLPTAGEGARGSPDAHQVLELEGGTVPDLESGVVARTGQRDQPEPRQPSREGGIVPLIRARRWRSGDWRSRGWRSGGWRAGTPGRVVAGRWGPFTSGASVGYRAAIGTEESQAPPGGGVTGERAGQVPGIGGVQGPEPGTSPGDCDQPSQVDIGMVRFTDPVSVGHLAA
jgi:hypothetical protein